MEEDIDMKQQLKVENLPDPTKYFDAVNKKYADQMSYDNVPIDELIISSIVGNKKNKNF